MYCVGVRCKQYKISHPNPLPTLTSIVCLLQRSRFQEMYAFLKTAILSLLLMKYCLDILQSPEQGRAGIRSSLNTISRYSGRCTANGSVQSWTIIVFRFNEFTGHRREILTVLFLHLVVKLMDLRIVSGTALFGSFLLLLSCHSRSSKLLKKFSV